MADTDKDKSKAKDKDIKPINDVAKPGEKAPSDTSRAIITHHPMMQDPMVKEPDNGSEIEVKTTSPSSGGEKVIAASSDAKEVEPKSDDTVAELAIKAKAKKEEEAEKAVIKEQEGDGDKSIEEPHEAIKTGDEATDKKEQTDEPEIDAAAAKKAEHDANVQKIIEAKTYELPITTSEKRRSTRFIILGILLAILLALAWVNIALDAGLIEIPGIKPVTHLFSN